jgi:DNA-binding transcriptional MerR regulator
LESTHRFTFIGVAAMGVAALAREVGVKSDTIRFYEREGLLTAAGRSPANYRRFDASAVDRIRFIQGAQRLGLRLVTIRELLAVRDSGECPCEPAATMLRQRLIEVDSEIEKLRGLRDDLVRIVSRIPDESCPDPVPGTWLPRKEVSGDV